MIGVDIALITNERPLMNFEILLRILSGERIKWAPFTRNFLRTDRKSVLITVVVF